MKRQQPHSSSSRSGTPDLVGATWSTYRLPVRSNTYDLAVVHAGADAFFMVYTQARGTRALAEYAALVAVLRLFRLLVQRMRKPIEGNDKDQTPLR